MAMVSGQRSALNPNAPAFVPAMYQRVEDFSPEWWELVKSTTWFRDYWLSLNPEGSFDDEIIEDLLPEEIDLAADMTGTVAGDVKLGAESEKYNALNGLIVDAKTLLRDLNQSPTRSPKEKIPRSGVEPAKFQMRPVGNRMGSPRPGGRRIQQPR